VSTWVRDDTVVAFLEERLSRARYVAVGEFHLYGADADLPVPRRMVALAKQYQLVLHAHSDQDAIERLFRQYPEARILWAHSGFERPEEVRDMLRKHKSLWCDLAFRSDQGPNGKVPAEWREVFSEFPDRFMVGTDTFTPERWHYIVEHANWSRAWLADLPPSLAERPGAMAKRCSAMDVERRSMSVVGAAFIACAAIPCGWIGRSVWRANLGATRRIEAQGMKSYFAARRRRSKPASTSRSISPCARAAPPGRPTLCESMR
jgi:hypothetical protein